MHTHPSIIAIWKKEGKSALSFPANNDIVIPDYLGEYGKGTAQMDKDRRNMPEIEEEEYEQIRKVPLGEDADGGEAASSRPARSRKPGSNRKEEGTHRSRRRGSSRGKGRGRGGVPLAPLFLACMLGIGAGLSGGYYMWGYEKPYMVDLKAVEVPSWVEQDFIRKNIFSRPDVTITRVNNIVIHYVVNPGSTARSNRDYFDSLADQDPEAGGTSSSSHFVVGLDGEVIQCIPVDEMAYANSPRNSDTISIENCHPDETGEFTQATYDSLVKLTACLCDQMDLTSADVIRHYDVNEKECPKYFVDHEDAWQQFREDVDQAIADKSWEDAL